MYYIVAQFDLDNPEITEHISGKLLSQDINKDKTLAYLINLLPQGEKDNASASLKTVGSFYSMAAKTTYAFLDQEEMEYLYKELI